MRNSLFAVGAAAILLSGCGDSSFVGRPDLTLVTNGQLPPPATVDMIGETRSYLIGPLDQVSVDVYGVPELSRTIQVDASGRISMPLVGTVEAAGKVPGDLARQIEDRLRGQYVRDPRVTINVTETVSQIVTVDGEVKAPGTFPIVGRMTLMRAIARAQGTTEFTRENYVIVFRRVNDKEMAALYDLRAIRDGSYGDPEIYANDLVYVGDSASRRMFKSLLQASGVLAAPLIAILQ